MRYWSVVFVLSCHAVRSARIKKCFQKSKNDTRLITILTLKSVIFLIELAETARFPSFGFCWYEKQIWAEVIWAEPWWGDGRHPIMPPCSLSGLGAISRSICSWLFDLNRTEGLETYVLYTGNTNVLLPPWLMCPLSKIKHVKTCYYTNPLVHSVTRTLAPGWVSGRHQWDAFLKGSEKRTSQTLSFCAAIRGDACPPSFVELVIQSSSLLSGQYQVWIPSLEVCLWTVWQSI